MTLKLGEALCYDIACNMSSANSRYQCLSKELRMDIVLSKNFK